TGDAGNFWSWFGRYRRFPARGRDGAGAFLGPTSGAMGYALPAAIGAAFAARASGLDVPVLAVAGDGGFLMTGQELETAVRHDLPVLALVFNNQSYGTIRMHQEREFPGRVSATALGPVDFAAFARALGERGARVADNRDFAPALGRALDGRGPALIEVVTDAEQISVGTTISALRAAR
ncbi:MAG: Thiamine pyrophosphate-requiring enzymes, partial [uncultured Thermomicrobiales bacterium]